MEGSPLPPVVGGIMLDGRSLPASVFLWTDRGWPSKVAATRILETTQYKESRPLLRSTPTHLGSYSLSYQGFY